MGTKIHVALSSDQIQGACLSARNQVDMKAFTTLWRLADWRGIQYIIADKGYDYSKIRQQIRSVEKIPIIPRRKGAVCPGVQDKERYKTRSAIERFFGKIKENKRLVLRFDKLDVTCFSFFALGCLKILRLLC